ncbi:MAG: thioredoxin [Planctomycetaceae bacterium]
MSTESSPLLIEPTETTFAADVIERSADLPVVVDFWAPWCGPCRTLSPTLETLAAEFDGRIVFAKVNTEEHPALAGAFQIQSIPTVIAFRDQQIFDAFQGALPEEAIREWLQRLLPTPAESQVMEAMKLEATDPAGAVQRFQDALQADPQLAPARIGLARALLSLDRLDEAAIAIAELESRGYLEPEAEKVRSQLHLAQAAKQGGGVAALQQSVTKAPDDLALQVQLADALAASGQFQAALDLCLQVIPRDRSGVGQQAKSAMLDILNTLDDPDLASEYRRKLASVLY